MRFEVAAAWGMGIALPLLEISRRRTNFHPIHAYVDDLIAGALLLVAARAVRNGRPNADAWLAGAWGVLCGGLYGSFFWQLSEIGQPDVSGQSGAVVVAVKGILLAVALAGFTLSLRRAASARV
jgi:hypothetical protein